MLCLFAFPAPVCVQNFQMSPFVDALRTHRHTKLSFKRSRTKTTIMKLVVVKCIVSSARISVKIRAMTFSEKRTRDEMNEHPGRANKRLVIHIPDDSDDSSSFCYEPTSPDYNLYSPVYDPHGAGSSTMHAKESDPL